MKLERIRAYKRKAPEITVCEIRLILGRFQISPKHMTRRTTADTFMSKVVCMDERGLKAFRGTSGKGLTESYALASGYAEFMERLENGLLYDHRLPSLAAAADDDPILAELLKENGLSFPHSYAPDERMEDGKVVIPFYSVFDDDIVQVPFHRLRAQCGSNGMCAGNDPMEAVLQGMSEVFERYALREIYLHSPVLPEIPLECFEGTTIYRLLERLRAEEHVRLSIRDCSLGMGLPVLGLLVQKRDGRCAFHLGSDPSPITALERCLSEMYQALTVESEDGGYFLLHGNDGDPFDWKTQFEKSLENGSGMWMKSLFGRDAGLFKGFEHPVSVSAEDDYRYMLDILRRNGRSLYVRDVSYLGFPAYQVYVPNMAEMLYVDDPAELEERLRFEESYKLLMRVPGLDRLQMKQLSDAFSNTPFAVEHSDVFPILPDAKADRDEVMFAIHMAAGERARAIAFLKALLESERGMAIPRLKFQRLLQDAEVGGDFDASSILSGENLINCYHCQSCRNRQRCAFLSNLRALQPLYDAQAASFPDQQALRQWLR